MPRIPPGLFLKGGITRFFSFYWQKKCELSLMFVFTYF